MTPDELQVTELSLPGVLQVMPPTVFSDHRGWYVETYNRPVYHAAGITQDFLQDDISVSTRDVLRGIHGDAKTWKLVSCLEGAFILAIVCWDRSSPHFAESLTLEVSEDNRRQVLIPPKHGNGHFVLTDRTIFHYKQTTLYDRPGQFTVRWNDPDIGIRWPTDAPILSDRDANGPFETVAG